MDKQPEPKRLTLEEIEKKFPGQAKVPDGDARVFVTLMASGLSGTSSGAKIATRTSSRITAAAMAPAGRRTTSRAKATGPRGS